MNESQTGTMLNNSPLTAHFMPRPRLQDIFDRATRCKLVYVVAGAGYGKTQTVHHYIQQQQDAVVRWVQLTENDNIGSRYWESLTHVVSYDNPDLAEKLRELGFPETLANFRQFAEILKKFEHRSHKTFLVLDDFHLIHSKQALTFAERCAQLHIPGACVIIISRNEPDINTVALFSKGKASIITQDELRFTEDEISAFFERREVRYSENDLPLFYDATKGWALAVKLLSLVLHRIPQNVKRALRAMKQNVFKLLETEAFDDFPEPVRKQLAQLSLISDLSAAPVNELFQDTLFTEYASQLASFIWFDSFFNDYRVHPLYMEFLQSRQDILTEDEKQDIYRRAAQWCFENDFYMDAMKYCAKSRQYDRMLKVFLSYPFKLPYDACEYYLGILKGIDPDDEESSSHSVLLLRTIFIPLLYVGMSRLEEARVWSLGVIRDFENSDAPISSYLLYMAYSHLAHIGTYTCTATRKYDFPEYLKKAVEYYKLSLIPPVKVEGPFGVVAVRSFACLVGEGAILPEFDAFVEAARETVSYVGQTHHTMFYGYDELAACELAFYKNHLDEARNHAHHAILEAREKKQHSIEMMAQYYLLCFAIHEGDYPLTKEILTQLREYLEIPSFWTRQLLYDLFAGSFYTLVEMHDRVPSWIALGARSVNTKVHIPVREQIVSIRFFLTAGKYKQALAVLNKAYPREPKERFLFGELTLSLLLSLTRYLMGDTAGSVRAFEKAYELSFCGVFEMPFVELGRAFNPLAAIALKDKDCTIPHEWLKTTGRKASAYAKKTAVITDAYKREEKIKDEVHLSERELQTLNDLYHGLSREEIAAIRYLSINTVNKILQSVFIKLDAGNSVDAIRIAIGKKLIE